MIAAPTTVAPWLNAVPRRAVLAGGVALLAGGETVAQPPTFQLKRLAARSGRLYGAAVEPGVVDADPAFAALVRAQCGVLTPENALKWNLLRPAPDVFDFRQADRVVELARAQGATVYGHCLVWHETVPPWLAQALRAGDARIAQTLLTDHIRRVVGRYRGVVRGWDVVNEFVEGADLRPDKLRNSIWLQKLGPRYIDLALHAARAADPRAKLTLSDYGLEYDDEPWMVEKRATMLALLRGLRARETPIDALGVQGHLKGERPPAFGAGFRRFLREVAALGLEIYVTELDVDDQKMAGSVRERDAASALIYQRFMEAVLAEPAVRSVVTWGLSDRDTSRGQFFPRPDGQPVRPLPFDADLRPKPSALAMAETFAAARA